MKIVPKSADFSTLKMEAIRSYGTSVQSTRSTRRHILEDGILHSHRRENLKSYTAMNLRGSLKAKFLHQLNKFQLLEEKSFLTYRINSKEQNTYFSCHYDECDVGNTGLIEGSGIRNVYSRGWTPLPHFPEFFLLQLQKVQFEVASLPLAELYVTSESV
jgi:hypothetical protein